LIRRRVPSGSQRRSYRRSTSTCHWIDQPRHVVRADTKVSTDTIVQYRPLQGLGLIDRGTQQKLRIGFGRRASADTDSYGCSELSIVEPDKFAARFASFSIESTRASRRGTAYLPDRHRRPERRPLRRRSRCRRVGRRLHYVYQTPDDRLIWDVGHQAYPHKVLTGRADRLGGIKQKGGLAPFPARYESEYDTFGVGHSSTSLSAALGMAIAATLTGAHRRIAAVIGDGAMSAGIAFEALNHIGSLNLDVLVVLNDNDMSISEATGAFANYLAHLLSSECYAKFREHSLRMLRRIPPALTLARGSEAFVREVTRPRTIFDDMGLNYVGPIDGHDLSALIPTLQRLRERSGPQLLHVVTTKGKEPDVGWQVSCSSLLPIVC
jgi:hypothetical protein